jgi:large subunit ribosomal protein L5
MLKSRLEELYKTKIRPELKKQLGLKNIMQVPRVSKIVLNVGATEAVKDSKVFGSIERGISRIAGQAPVRTFAHKSIAGFKIREDMPLGVKVTLRGTAMYHFLDKLINAVLPNVRDFQGISLKSFDRGGNYNLGVKEWTIFPEAETSGVGDLVSGLNITINTTAKNEADARALLKNFGMPFKKEKEHK